MQNIQEINKIFRYFNVNFVTYYLQWFDVEIYIITEKNVTCLQHKHCTFKVDLLTFYRMNISFTVIFESFEHLLPELLNFWYKFFHNDDDNLPSSASLWKYHEYLWESN